MRHTPLFSLGAFLFAIASCALAAQPSDPSANSNAGRRDHPNRSDPVEIISDAQDYVDRTRFVAERAHEGDYGHIRRNDMKRLDRAAQAIEQLFGDRTGEIDLSDDEQITLANAQETINAIIRADDKSRLVCKKVAGIGTRIPKTECLSVAQREHQAETARDVIKIANDYCVPSEGNPCSR